MKRRSQVVSTLSLVGFCPMASTALRAASGSMRGQITDPQGKPVADAKVAVQGRDSRLQETRSDSEGQFAFSDLPAGEYELVGSAPSFADVSESVNSTDGGSLTVNLRFDRLVVRNQSIAVTADVTEVDVQSPDPAVKVFASKDLVDANPGRPGAPISMDLALVCARKARMICDLIFY